MKVVLQRVFSAKVSVDGETVGEIGGGLVAFIGFGQNDTADTVIKTVDKISRLRIFADSNGKTNLSSKEVNAEILAISQFTLMGDCLGQNRPSFSHALNPKDAQTLYALFSEECTQKFTKTAKGQFGAHMHVSAENDGPFTLIIDA
ncbi:MAG: D-aminoacyl-tRNA deacylase [Firmicutes bacterium]|nr:D-aminoacyl-tRNA deacylase [Bacillota bacterium]